MLADAREVPAGCLLRADLAIVGGGPAGLTIANELRTSGLTVILLEAGGAVGNGSGPDCFRGEVEDLVRHPPIDMYRRQGLGGTSSIWGGRCVPFDPIDFEARPYVPWSGWPISFEGLEPYYRSAVDYCQAGPFRFRVQEALAADAAPMVSGLRRPDIDVDGLERFSQPLDFGRQFRRDLARAGTTTVLLHARCIGVETTSSGTAVARLRAAAEPGREFAIQARAYVLAAGGLETPRLLLASDIGNRRGHVGRFYMCHLEGKAALARFAPGTKVIFDYERDRHGVYLHRYFSFPADVQRTLGMTNVILRFEPPTVADPSHGNPVLSALYLAHALIEPEYGCKLGDAGGGYGGLAARPSVRAHLANVMRGLPGLARFATRWTTRHWLARRKLPYLAAATRDGALYLDFNAEQTPNPDSRVTLGTEKDAFGLPRLHVAWRVSEADVDGIVIAHRLLASAMRESGAGQLTIDEMAIREGYRAMGGHHIGTARMAGDPSQGVVDGDCRVFGIDNLYVAGSAVFPTSSHANPTLTLVALAARLAAHLRALARSAPDRMPLAAE